MFCAYLMCNTGLLHGRHFFVLFCSVPNTHNLWIFEICLYLQVSWTPTRFTIIWLCFACCWKTYKRVYFFYCISRISYDYVILSFPLHFLEMSSFQEMHLLMLEITLKWLLRPVISYVSYSYYLNKTVLFLSNIELPWMPDDNICHELFKLIVTTLWSNY